MTALRLTELAFQPEMYKRADLASSLAGKLYLAYLRDPDVNKICALHRPAK